MPEVSILLGNYGRGSRLPYNGTRLLTRRWRLLRFAKQTANLRDQRLGIARLYHHGIEAGRTRQIELLDVGIPGRGDQGNCSRVRTRFEIPSYLVPGFSGEFEVHNDHVRFFTHGFCERTLTVGSGQHGEAFGAEVDSPYVKRIGVVIDDEEAGT